MKFRLSTLFLASALVAALIGWHFERRHYRLEYEKHRDATVMTQSVLHSPRAIASLVAEIGRHDRGEITTEELGEFARCRLWQTVVNLYAVSKMAPASSSILDAPNYQQQIRLRTWQPLYQLGVSDRNELSNLLATEPELFRSGGSVVNSEGNFTPEFLLFAEQVFSSLDHL